jgi:hypothetical protein
MLMMMSRALEMKCPWHSITTRFWEALDESASCGLDSGIGFMKCCGMCTLAHKCLVVPVGMTVLWAMLLPAGCKSMGFWISSASSTGQRLLSEREHFQGMKTKPIQT